MDSKCILGKLGTRQEYNLDGTDHHGALHILIPTSGKFRRYVVVKHQ